MIPGGWWEFEGDEAPGLVVTSSGVVVGDPDAARSLLRLVDADERDRRSAPP
jgi:hypothetical protein